MWQWIVKWFYRLGSPKWFYETTTRWCLPWCAWISGTLISISIIWGLAFAPPDYQMGNSFRIIYVHVPANIIAMGAYVFMALVGAIGLIWKMKLADMVAKCTAPIGASFTALSLTSGAIWGAPTWGTWWEWDARLTSMLILLFLYMGIIGLHSSIKDATRAAKATAILALVGVVNVVIVHYSVIWWNTLHQPPSTLATTAKAANPPEVWIPLVLGIFGCYLFFATVLMMRVNNEVLQRERKTQWVEALIRERYS